MSVSCWTQLYSLQVPTVSDNPFPMGKKYISC